MFFSYYYMWDFDEYILENIISSLHQKSYILKQANSHTHLKAMQCYQHHVPQFQIL